MQHPPRLRSGLASLIVLTTLPSAILAACGDGSNGALGEIPDTGLTDATPSDSASNAKDSGPTANTARLTVINATHDLGPSSSIGATGAIRLCFKQGSVAQNLSVAPYPPLPDKFVPGNPPAPAPVGMYYGTGATLPTVGLELAGRIIVPIVMNVRSLAARGLDTLGPDHRPRTCDQLVGDTPSTPRNPDAAADAADAAGTLVENTDYWVLPQIEPGTLANEKAYILALTGCAGDATTPNPGKCGIGFVSGGGPSVGNLKLTIYETTQTPVASPFGAQFLHVSTQANAFFSQAAALGFIHPGFMSNADGGGFRPITDVNPPIAKLEAVVSVPDVAETDSFVFGPKSPSEAAPLLPSSLLAIQAYSGLSPSTGATAYPSGQNYVFIAVGDPDTSETKPFLKPDGNPGGDGGDGSRFNSRFFHFLAYPTDPPIQP